MSEEMNVTAEERLKSLRSVTHVLYALYALSLFTFVTAIVGIVINYVKLGDARGTWLESHFSWQIRTFWFSLLWAIFGVITLYFIIGGFILLADFVWVIYRIAKGWLDLNDGKPMPA